MIVKIDEKARTMTITVPLQEPAPSASGKTLVIASTRGNLHTTETYKGKPVVIGFNAYISK